LAVLYNETLGSITGRLWNDNTFMLWTALIFAVWSLAWTVIDAAESVSKKRNTTEVMTQEGKK
jgi:hypothetical protein